MQINVRVVPGSKKNKIIKLDSKNYRVKVVAAPIAGQANKELINVLAEYFCVEKKAIRIVSGLHSRNKTIDIIQS